MAAKPRGVVLQEGRSGFSIYPENREQLCRPSAMAHQILWVCAWNCGHSSFIVVTIHIIYAKYNGLEMNVFRSWTDSLLLQIWLCHAQGFGLSQASIKKTQLKVPPSGN